MKNLKVLCSAVFAALALVTAHGATYENPVPMTETVQRGKWYKGYSAVRVAADEAHAPSLTFAGKTSCSHCHNCEVAMMTDTFLKWQEEANIYMGMAIAQNGSGEYTLAVNFAKTPNDIKAELPYLCLYWKKKDGTLYKYNLCGQKKEIDAEGNTLEERLVNLFSTKLKEWGYVPPRIAKFDCGNTIGDRLEAQVDYTTFVDVPFVQETSADETRTETLIATYPDATTFVTNLVWNEGESTKKVRIEIPEGIKAGDVINLKLANDSAMETNQITIVERGNSPKNPTWKGVSAFGEWTMDLEAAQKFAADARASEPDQKTYVVGLLGGSLWCPDCARTDAYLIETEAFKTWATEKRVVCVAIDIPNFSASAPLTGPCLLTRETKNVSQSYIAADSDHSEVQSGAGYLSRWMISDEEAAEKLAANRWLVGTSTMEGGLNRPERANRYRTGVPVFVVLNEDGTVAARIETFASKSPSVMMDGYINRLNEMLAAADEEGTEDNVNEATTSDSLEIGKGTYEATVSGGDLTDVIELTSVDTTARTHIDVSATIGEGLGLSISLLEKVGTNAADVVSTLSMAATNVDGRVSADFVAAEGARYFLKVTLTGLEADEGAVKFGRTGDATVAYSLVGSIEQVPGMIEFEKDAQSIFVPDGGEGSVTVRRVGGRSGAATVRVYVKDAGTAEGLYNVPATNLVWAAGETNSQNVSFNVWRGDELAAGSFTLALEAVGETDVAVSEGSHVVTLTDTDDPCFANFNIELEPYSSFSLNETLELRNVEAGVAATIRRTSGKLPSGVTLKYDRKTGSVILSGTPKTPGTYTVTYTVTQNRVTGLPATLTFTVVDPQTINSYVSTKRTSQTIPLLGIAEDGTKIMEGTLTVAITAKNRITAKHVGLNAKSTSYSGSWQTIENGYALAELTARDGTTLYLEMDDEGTISASIPDYEIAGWAAWPEGYFLPWMGHYTLTFPVKDENIETGTATALMDITAAGKVKWSVVRSNGTKSSGTTTLIPTDDEGLAYAALFSRNSSSGFSALIEIGADGISAWDKTTGSYAPQIIHAAENTAVYEIIGTTIGDWRYAFGSWYKSNITLTELTDTFDYSDTYTLVSPALEDKTLIAQAKKFVLAETDRTFRISFAPRTGLFSGSVKVLAPSGKTVTAKYSGVLMPGWDECGACVEGFTAYERPFGSGTLYYNDNSKTYTLPIDIQATSIDE